MHKKPGEVKTLLKNQVVLTAFITFAFLPFGQEFAISAMLGGAIVVFSGLIATWMIFKNYRAQQPDKLVGGFYSAEIVKLVFTMMAFALIVMNIQTLNFLTLFTVFFIIQVVPALYLAARK